MILQYVYYMKQSPRTVHHKVFENINYADDSVVDGLYKHELMNHCIGGRCLVLSAGAATVITSGLRPCPHVHGKFPKTFRFQGDNVEKLCSQYFWSRRVETDIFGKDEPDHLSAS